MEEKTLLIISIICTCIGLSVLYYIFLNTDVAEVDNIENHLDETIKIKGIVKSYYIKDGITFVKIEKQQLIPVVFFEEVNLEKNKKIEIIGEVSKYNNEFEIIGKEII